MINILKYFHCFISLKLILKLWWPIRASRIQNYVTQRSNQVTTDQRPSANDMPAHAGTWSEYRRKRGFQTHLLPMLKSLSVCRMGWCEQGLTYLKHLFVVFLQRRWDAADERHGQTVRPVRLWDPQDRPRARLHRGGRQVRFFHTASQPNLTPN